MKLKLCAILVCAPALWAGERLPVFKGEQFTISVPSGYKIVSTAPGEHDASQGSVPFFTALNDRNHLIMGFFDSSSIVRPEEIPAIIDLFKKNPMTPTSRIVASGMVDDGKGGRIWGMVEADDSKATKQQAEHVVILLTSTDDSLLRVIIGGPHGDATALVNEANEFLSKFKKQEKAGLPNKSPEPTAPSGRGSS